jgi:peptidoglycan/xylan/chitin deacetylase (PgdA/CDA1 family)
MSAQYLLRFDDLCPTMSWAPWREIEALLVDTGVVPVLAVVPANADPKLCVDPPDPGFWDSVRRWQERGWTIGLHGYTHQYVTDDGGIMGIHPQSEFAGLPRDLQRDKLTRGLEIFAAQGVRADVWVAPGHSFDRTTLQALRESGLTCVSDGFMPYPGRDEEGMTWVPQQLWHFRPLPFGVWTVCIHHNQWGPREVAALRADLRRYADRMTSFAELQRRYGDRSLGRADQLVSGAYRVAFALKRAHRRLALARPGERVT